MMDKIKNTARRAAEGAMRWLRRCYGADTLGLVLLIAGLALVLLGRVLNLGLLHLPALALYIWAIYRMASHDTTKRFMENRRFTQWFTRLKNARQYKYYRCPKCRARLRMPRGIGEKTVTCSACGHSFRKKA